VESHSIRERIAFRIRSERIATDVLVGYCSGRVIYFNLYKSLLVDELAFEALDDHSSYHWMFGRSTKDLNSIHSHRTQLFEIRQFVFLH